MAGGEGTSSAGGEGTSSAEGEGKPGRYLRAGWPLRLALVVVGFGVGALAGMPELVTSPSGVLAGIAEQARLGGVRWNGQSPAPVWQLYAVTLAHGLGWSVLALSALGAAVLARRRPLLALAQIAVPLACLAVMLRQELFFARFALPLLPSLAILAGHGIAALAVEAAHLWPGRTGRSVAIWSIAMLLLLLALLPGAQYAARHNQLATTPDTRVLAQQWLRANANGADVATEVYGLPLAWGGSSSPREYRLARVSALVEPAGVRRLACDGTRYFLVASLTAEREVARRPAGRGETGYDLLARQGKAVATFDPFVPGRQIPAHTDNTGLPFWSLEAYERPGPRIVVYDLSHEAAGCPARGGA